VSRTKKTRSGSGSLKRKGIGSPRRPSKLKRNEEKNGVNSVSLQQGPNESAEGVAQEYTSEGPKGKKKRGINGGIFGTKEIRSGDSGWDEGGKTTIKTVLLINDALDRAIVPLQGRKRNGCMRPMKN